MMTQFPFRFARNPSIVNGYATVRSVITKSNSQCLVVNPTKVVMSYR